MIVYYYTVLLLLYFAADCKKKKKKLSQTGNNPQSIIWETLGQRAFKILSNSKNCATLNHMFWYLIMTVLYFSYYLEVLFSAEQCVKSFTCPSQFNLSNSPM